VSTISTAAGFSAKAPLPDTIESGGRRRRPDQDPSQPGRWNSKADGRSRIIEPLSSFYKDEVRAIGRELSLPQSCWSAIPSRPGLAIRCLCSEHEAELQKVEEGWILPVRSVACKATHELTGRCWRSNPSPPQMRSRDVINRRTDVNRIVGIATLRADRKP